VFKTDAPSEIRYFFDNTSLISETDASNSSQIRYNAANGLVSQEGPAGLLYYLSDGLGSARYLINSTESIVSKYSFDAFGNIVSQTGNAFNPLTFKANYGYYQNKNQLYLIGARHYRADYGRLLQVDPQYQGTNWYSYALNDPVNLVDPTGEWVHVAIGGGVGAGISTAVYLISTPRNQWTWGGGLRAGATGAIVGAVGAATFGASMPATLGGAVIRGAAAGLTTTLAGDLTDSAFDQKLRFSSPFTYARNAAIGGALSTIAYGVGRAIQHYRSTNVPNSQAIAGSGASNTAGSIVRYGPMNPGPLPDSVTNTFRSGSYTANTLSQPTTLYRVHGGSAGPLGNFWTRTPPAGPLQAKIDLAIRPEWGNTATQVTRITVPPGTTIFEGAAASQGGLVGGGNQVFIPRVDPSWVAP
jgi:RHS repeat-associated protein